MSQLLTWSEVDSDIQDKMAGQAPDESKRLSAINNRLKLINTAYNIETGKRRVSISVIPNGETAYDLSSLITDNDLKSPDDVRFELSDDSGQPEFRYVDYDKFSRNIAAGVGLNEFTIYYEDGVQYIRINTTGRSETATTFDMIYFTNMLALDGDDNFQKLVDDDVDYKILLPLSFKDLLVKGCLIDLAPIALGDDSLSVLPGYKQDYNIELRRLGLNDIGHGIKNKARKVKVRPI